MKLCEKYDCRYRDVFVCTYLYSQIGEKTPKRFVKNGKRIMSKVLGLISPSKKQLKFLEMFNR